MRTRGVVEAVEVLDLLLKFLGAGERWVKAADLASLNQQLRRAAKVPRLLQASG
jgi:hypothetical protein